MRTAIVAIILALTGCAHVPSGSWTCSGSSVLAVVDSIAAGEPSTSIEDAAKCWLDLWRDRPQLESSEAHPSEVDVLEQALQSGDGVAEALTAADAALPGVCRGE